MIKEITKKELRDIDSALLYPDTAESISRTYPNIPGDRHKGSAPISPWKQAIMELSRNQGYTGIAL
ncbi:MAG: hypothetical protein A4E58_02939 [Syntrophorhabdus sp. PtaB.Bin006]|nr:MAG: hypothetical protein A4E58_02939 [Syntrophorhabdus sp. PtaB.Bin006]